MSVTSAVLILRLRAARVNRPGEKVGRRFNARRLDNLEVKRAFVGELQAKAVEIQAEGTIVQQWTASKNAVTATSVNTLGELLTRKKEWISDDTLRGVEERREAKADIERARTRAAKERTHRRYAELETNVKRFCRRDKRAWTDSVADEAERVATTGDIRLRHLPTAWVRC